MRFKCLDLDEVASVVAKIASDKMSDGRMNDRDVPETWKCVEFNRFYGFDEHGELMCRRGGRKYTHRKCGFQAVIPYNYCPRCGQKMKKEEE